LSERISGGPNSRLETGLPSSIRHELAEFPAEILLDNSVGTKCGICEVGMAVGKLQRHQARRLGGAAGDGHSGTGVGPRIFRPDAGDVVGDDGGDDAAERGTDGAPIRRRQPQEPPAGRRLRTDRGLRLRLPRRLGRL